MAASGPAPNDMADARAAVVARGRGHPWIVLRDGAELVDGSGVAALASGDGAAEPRSLAAGDLDGDRVPDLVSGFARPPGGVLVVHRGNVDFLYPDSPAAARRRAEGTFQAQPFLLPGRVLELPAAPDFVAIGDFDDDGNADVIAAAAGNKTAQVLLGDGTGHLTPPTELRLPGPVTAMVGGEIDRADGVDDLVVAVSGRDGAELLVFESPAGALGAEPERHPLPAPAADLALGQLDEHHALDLVVAAGDHLVLLHGRDRGAELRSGAPAVPATLETRPFPFALVSLAIGRFVGADGREVAMLAEDGSVHIVASPDIDPTTGAGRMAADGLGGPDLWSRAVTQLDARYTGPAPPGRTLVSAKISSLPRDTLIAVDPKAGQLRLLHAPHFAAASGDAQSTPQGLSAGEESEPVALDVVDGPVAVLPMRLNLDGLADLVVLKRGSNPIATVIGGPAAIFTVNSPADDRDADVNDGQCRTDNGVCTLRAAIQQANNSPGMDTVNFAVNAVETAGFLPAITQPLNVLGPDGRVEARHTGGVIGSPALTFDANAAGSVVRRMAIVNFPVAGILIGANQVTVQDCYVGLERDGDRGGNQGIGIDIVGSHLILIGGDLPGEGNVISANQGAGISISKSTNLQVVNNFIGLPPSGSAQPPNLREYGNGFDGIRVTAGEGPGVEIRRNVISGNTGSGITLDLNVRGVVVRDDNRIGTNSVASQAIGNGFAGIAIQAGASDNTIGGTRTGDGNVIAANDAGGVLINWADDAQTTNNRVQGNWIGTNLGNTDLGNSLVGVAVFGALANTIGGTARGAGNTIAYTRRSDGVGGVGILVVPIDLVSDGTRNRIAGNNVFANAGLGIDLTAGVGLDGVTPNDASDPDQGANTLQNYPGLSVDQTGAIRGTLDSTPSSDFEIEFFTNRTCDPTAFGEGETFLAMIGGLSVSTGATGRVDFAVDPGIYTLPAGEFLSATATDVTLDGTLARNNTSEFSRCIGREGATPTTTVTRTATSTRPTVTRTPTWTPTPVEPPAGTISGRVFYDLDQDGRRDADEPRLPGWTIFLDANGDGILNNPAGAGVCGGGARERCTTTDLSGAYAFNLPAGVYRTRQVLQPGWRQTSVNPPDLVIPTAGQSFQDIDFGNAAVGDCDGNAEVSIGELIRGVNIALGSLPPSACFAFDADGDGEVAIAELVSAVNNALGGLPRPPTPTPTATGPPPPPTATPTAPPARYCDELISPLPIPDGDLEGVSDQIIVPDDRPIADLDVHLFIAHTWVGDLTVGLRHMPSGREAVLLARPGQPASELGCGADDVECTLDDEASRAAEDECSATPPALGGRLRPSASLSVFDGARRGGAWVLSVSDRATLDEGLLLGWCLELQ